MTRQRGTFGGNPSGPSQLMAHAARPRLCHCLWRSPLGTPLSSPAWHAALSPASRAPLDGSATSCV
eukprot:5200513-Prymnesium_polylepis.2